MDSQDSPWPRFERSHRLPIIIFLWLAIGVVPKCHFVLGFPIWKLGVLKFPKLRFQKLWKLVISCANLQLKWHLKQIFIPFWELLKYILHATYMHVIQDDFWLLVVGNQIDTLTPDLSFGHNLCYKYSNGSCKPILDIYVSRTFQWYNELFNSMSFDPWNPSLKIWESIGILTFKVGVHLGVCGFIPSHSFTFLGVQMWFLGCTIDPHLSLFLLWLQMQG